MTFREALLGAVLALSALGCSIGKRSLPDEPPPLLDLEEPLELQAEPNDEAARAALPAGSFTGIFPEDARSTLDALLGESGGVQVARVVENSPADVAGIAPGDIVVEAALEGRGAVALKWPSEWRELELAAAPGSRIEVVVDRAGSESRHTLVTAARARPAPREPAQRFREEKRVGVVVRTATEVEARAAELPPGAGAVVVGLARRSPWRAAGVRYGDLVCAVDGKPVADPEVLLQAIRAAEPGGTLELDVVRDVGRDVGRNVGRRETVPARVGARERELKDVSIPLLYSYERSRGSTEWSVLFGLVGRESTRAASKWRVLWFITFTTGDADRLREESS